MIAWPIWGGWLRNFHQVRQHLWPLWTETSSKHWESRRWDEFVSWPNFSFLATPLCANMDWYHVNVWKQGDFRPCKITECELGGSNSGTSLLTVDHFTDVLFLSFSQLTLAMYLLWPRRLMMMMCQVTTHHILTSYYKFYLYLHSQSNHQTETFNT